MYPRYKIIALIERLAVKSEQILGLTKWDITWEVINSKKTTTDHARCSYSIKTKKAFITIYFDNCTGFKDAVGSILHELLHIKLGKLSEAIELKNLPKRESVEEDIVARVEALLLHVLADRKI